MNKKSVIISVLFVCLLIFALGAFETYLPEQTGDTYFTFTDSEGTLVELKKKPQRVAVLFSSLAETWITAGGEVSITVGETTERGLCPESVLLADSGAGKTIDNERLISYEPDFVICSADIASHKETAKLLKKAGIPVAMIRIDSFSDYLLCLEVFCKITGKEENYALYGENQKAEIDGIILKSKSLRQKDILFIRSGSSASSAKAKKAEDNFAAKMLSELGCNNIADKAEVLLDGLSAEAILTENPEYIFISLMGDSEAGKEYMTGLLKKEEFASLSAVKNGKVYFLPKELFQYKPCSRWAESYRYLSDILYSE